MAEVEFSEWTHSDSLRQPRYKGLREDKPAHEVVREAGAPEPTAAGERERSPGRLLVREQGRDGALASVDGRELKLSNLTKLLYPDSAFTKRALLDYYLAIAPVLIGHLEGRPLTLTRWPDGVEGKSFFQKQAPAHRPEWVRTVTLPSGRTPRGTGKPIDYVLAEDRPTLVWLANLAALELHTPLARAEAIDRPTAVVFDLDPGEPATILECCEVGLRLHALFEELGLRSLRRRPPARRDCRCTSP